MMDKYDKAFYLEIKNILISKYNVTYDIFKHAKLMDIDITKLFCDSLVENKNKDALVSQILGIYGNYFATHEFVMKGYKVINEYEIVTKDKEVTKADVAFKKDNELILCEVKMAKQMILNKNNYVNCNNLVSKKDIALDKKKYFEMANKLLKQVKKLKKVTNEVRVIIFQNCFIDNDLKEELSKIGVKESDIIIVPVDVNDLYDHAKTMVYNIFSEYEKNV